MRLFLGGVITGCLSSAGVFFAHSLSKHDPWKASPLQLTTDTPITPTPPLQVSTQAPSPPTTQLPQHYPSEATITVAIHPFPSTHPPVAPPTQTSQHFLTDSPLLPHHTQAPEQHPIDSHLQPSAAAPLRPPLPNKTHVEPQLPQPLTDTSSLTSQAEQILTYGTPSGGRVRLQYHNHVLEYDCSRRIPSWVAEHLTRDSLQGDGNRSRSQFTSEPGLPEECRAYNSDYRGSGWSKGHMAPAADSKRSQEAMDHTFRLSNILPQDVNNNARYWNRLEIFCRDLTQQYSHVWVTSGPVFLPTVSREEEGGDGRKRVTYEVIGESEVAVPTHLFKIIVAQEGEQVATGAFMVPNKPLSYEHHLKSFQVPLHQLERRVGSRFFADLDRSSAKDLCEETGCNLLTKEQMDLLIYTSRLKRADNLHKLDRLWKEIKKKQVPVTSKLQNLYESRLGELNEAATTSEKRGQEEMKRGRGVGGQG